MYKYDDDEEEFYLDCYDEMHNHVLIADPRIMPFPKKNFSRPSCTIWSKLKVGSNFQIKWCNFLKKDASTCTCEEDQKVISMISDKKNKIGSKKGLNRIKDTLIDSFEIMFQCTFKLHGLCQSMCIKQAAKATTRRDLLEMISAAEVERGEKSKYKSNYVIVKCPFKLIYREMQSNDKKHEFQYRLVRHEMNHIHPVDFWNWKEKGVKRKEKKSLFWCCEYFNS